MSEIKKQDQQYIANTYARFPLQLVNGMGAEAFDEQGNRYIDMGSGIGVTSFGYCDPAWITAVANQLSTLQHTSNLYYTEPCVKLAKLLCERTGAGKVFFSNSGAEANECAIKVARKYMAEKKGEDCYTIITLENSFHGRTITTLAATGQEVFHKTFKPLTDGFMHLPANDLEAVKTALSQKKIAAVMIECVQGEGGVLPLDPDYVKALAALLKEQEVLLIVDEVQTGNGRTGKLYAEMHYGITPDIVSTAKGLGGGLPIGATLLYGEGQNTLHFGDHGSTYGGNPVCCAGAYSIIERLDEDFLKEVQEKSDFVFESLKGAKGIKSVNGLGLMIGIETAAPAKEILLECMARGVLCLTAKTKLRLLPPLNITTEQLSEALDVIKAVAAEKEERNA